MDHSASLSIALVSPRAAFRESVTSRRRPGVLPAPLWYTLAGSDRWGPRPRGAGPQGCLGFVHVGGWSGAAGGCAGCADCCVCRVRNDGLFGHACGRACSLWPGGVRRWCRHDRGRPHSGLSQQPPAQCPTLVRPRDRRERSDRARGLSAAGHRLVELDRTVFWTIRARRGPPPAEPRFTVRPKAPPPCRLSD